MRKSDEEKVKRVRSAKAWLEKAEESFGKQSDVRGELNLMLAEAEMKQMRKKERHSRGLRKIAAAGTAAVIARACWQLTGWEKTTTVRPLPAPAPAALQEEKAKPPESVPATPARAAPPPAQELPADTGPGSAALPDTAPAAPQAAGQQPDTADSGTTAPAPAVQHTQPVQEKVLTDSQVQAAVQDARHSLRGTEIKK